jgi:hypothetical protein
VQDQPQLSAAPHAAAMSTPFEAPTTPTDAAHRAVVSARRGDVTGAAEHLRRARALGRSRTRRDRQLLQIAALIVAGDMQRAAGLALEHVAAFPHDADVAAGLDGK